MPTAFFARTNGKMEKILFLDILYITARKNYSEIVLISGRKICVYVSLTGLQEQLPRKLFCRIHRSHLISIEHIDAFDHDHVWVGKEKLPVGRTYFEQLTRELLIICGEQEMKIRKGQKPGVREVLQVTKQSRS